VISRSRLMTSTLDE